MTSPHSAQFRPSATRHASNSMENSTASSLSMSVGKFPIAQPVCLSFPIYSGSPSLRASVRPIMLP
jgi:hypothetical protein